VEGLRAVLDAARSAGATHTLVHTCAAEVPLPLLTRAGPEGVSLDVSLLGAAGWEALAPHLESGLVLWAGAVPTSGGAPSPATVADAVWTPWRRLGLDVHLLDQVVITPTCGLASSSPAVARTLLSRAGAGARELASRAQG